MRCIKLIFFAYLTFTCLAVSPVFSQTRSFDEIFPRLPSPVRNAVFSGEGYSKSFEKIQRSALIGSEKNSIEPQIIESLFHKQPGFIVESIQIIPAKTGGSGGSYSLLDVYNALGKTGSLAGWLYRSHTRKESVPLFEEVTRIESSKRNTTIPDPPPASAIPRSETVYLRIKDINFGNSFYRGDMKLTRYGLQYGLTNYKNLTYRFVTVIKEEKFSAQLYFEPITEGILIYGIAGADVSDFISSRIDMCSAINKRLAVILSWVSDGIIKSPKHD